MRKNRNVFGVAVSAKTHNNKKKKQQHTTGNRKNQSEMLHTDADCPRTQKKRTAMPSATTKRSGKNDKIITHRARKNMREKKYVYTN